MRDHRRWGIAHRTSRLILIAFTTFLATFAPAFGQNFSVFFSARQVLAQTPNRQQLDKKPVAAVSGSFIDYFAQEREIKGHESSVNSASFSPDGKLIVTAGADKTARIWDFAGKQVAELVGHEGSVKSASFSPDDKLIVTASFDGSARVWDLSGKQLTQLKGHQGNIYSASFSPDGKKIVTAGADGTVRVWDISGKQVTEIKVHSGSVYSASFSPNGKRIVSASADKTARVWDWSGKLLTELKGHTDTVWSASFSLDGKQIVTASDDKTARLWDVSGKQLVVLQGHQDSVLSASFSPDGKQIVTASVDETALIWDATGKLVGKLQGHEGGVNGVNWSKDGRWIITASSDSSSRVWDTFSKEFIELKKHQHEVYRANFSPDSKRIVTASKDKTARIWDITSKQITELKGHQSVVNSASFSPDGKLIVTASAESVRVWDNSGKLLTELKGHQSDVNSASFSPDGKLIVTASNDGTARIWDVSGKLITELKGHKEKVTSASFSPDGKLIVTAFNDGTARIWDVSGKLITELKGHKERVTSASFSPDGKLIVTTSTDGTARIYDTSGKQLTQIEHPPRSSEDDENNAYTADFSPDSKLIVTVSKGSTAWVWDLSGKLITELRGHQDEINSASFSPDGKLIVTTSWDGTARVWYVAKKLQAQQKLPTAPFSNDKQKQQTVKPRFNNEDKTITSVTFSPDDKLIVTGSKDGTVQLWDTSGKLLTELKGHQYQINSISFSPDGKLIVTAAWDFAKVWDASSSKLLATLEANGHTAVSSASLSPNGNLVVTTYSSDENNAYLWDVSGKQLAEFKGHKGSVNSASFSSDSKLIVTASYDKTARIWNTSGKQLAELKGHQDAVTNASFSPDSKLIVTVSDSVRVWDTNGKLITKLKGSEYSRNAIFSSNGKLIITSSYLTSEVSTSFYPTSRVWDTSGNLLAEGLESITFSPDSRLFFMVRKGIAIVGYIASKQSIELKGHQGDIKSANFSHNSKLIVTLSKTSYAKNIVQVWDTNGKLLAELKPYPSTVYDARFSFDGNFILTAFDNGNVRVWDTNGKLTSELKAHLSNVKNASLSPDGKLIVTVFDSHAVIVLDISGKLRTELPTTAESASFSPDSKLIVTTSFGSSQLWDTSGHLLANLEGGSASFNPNSKLIVTSSYPKTVRVWNTSGKLLAELNATTQGYDSVGIASVSADGRLIVTTFSHTAQLWDISGKLLTELKGHKGDIKSASFSPDGQHIVTASDDGTTRVWDTSGKLLTELKGHQGNVSKANFSPDGQHIVTASDDGTARVWNLSGKQLAILKLDEKITSSPKAEADRLRDLQFYAPNCAQAFDPWQKALKIYQEMSDNENQAVILEKLGNAYYCLGDYTNAIKSYTQASTIAQKFNYSQLQAKNLSNLGNVYNTLADYETAINKYNLALKLLSKENSQSKAETLRGRGNVYNYQGKYSEAIQDYLQALAIDEAIKNTSSIAESKVNFASIYLASGDANKAIQYYKEALELKPIEALSGLGNVYLTLGDINKAIDLYQQSLAKAQQEEDKEGEGNALNNLGFALYKSSKFPETEKNLRAAIEVWENLRTKLDDTNKISIFEKQTRTYRLLQQVLITQNKIDAALEIAERGRARAFVELIARRLSPNQKEKLNITPLNIEQIKQIAKTEKASLVQYSLITDEFKTEGKQQTKESELYIWVIKPSGEVIFRKSDLKALLQKDNLTLEKLVTTSRESIDVRGRNPINRNVINVIGIANKPKQVERLQELHKLLIKPIADILPSNPNERVIFIPQSSLFLVPYPALRKDDQDKYLIEKHTILTAPSIQVLDLTRQQRQKLVENQKSSSLPNLVVGNPTMPSVPPAPGQQPIQLPPLAGAEKEAQVIAPLLNTKAIIGSQGTKASVVQKMPSARIIHLATHGLLDDYRGLGSAIALAPDSSPSKPGEINGLLTAEEILDMKLQAELVVLSACDTGRGKITGDGVIGLSRSLISAGVPSVMVSLWSIPDSPTAELMSQFYTKKQQRRMDKAQALRQAMLTTMKTHPSPKDWAAFTLIGESE